MARLIDWLRGTMLTEGTISEENMWLFKIVDDISSIPEEIDNYFKSENHGGFQIPKQEKNPQ